MYSRFSVSRRRRLNREIVAMCVFIDFARLEAALNCCRNVVFIRLRLQAGHGLGLAVLFIAGLWCSAALAQQPTDEEVARAVRIVRNGEGVIMPTAASTRRRDIRDRVEAAMQFLTMPKGQAEVDILYRRVADEFIRQDALENLFGFKFGVGLSATTNRRKGAIKEVVVDSNRVVRVTREEDTSIGYLLEAHYFFVPDRPFLNLTTGNWGIGPFVAIQAGNEKALSGLGFGLMVGFRQLGTGTIPTANLSWNFGIGAIYDPSVKVLGNGLVADRPLPAGDSLRTTEVGSWGLMVMSSFNF